MGEMLNRINEVLDHVFKISPQNVKTYCHNGPWNTTLCKIVFDRYLHDTGGQPELAERTLKLMHIVRSFLEFISLFQLSQTSCGLNWRRAYMKLHFEEFVTRFTQHCNQQEVSAANRLFNLLRE